MKGIGGEEYEITQDVMKKIYDMYKKQRINTWKNKERIKANERRNSD